MKTNKFNLGDKVREMRTDRIGVVKHICMLGDLRYEYVVEFVDTKTESEWIDESYFYSYKDEDDDIDLCNLLKNQIGLRFYCPMFGYIKLKEIRDHKLIFNCNGNEIHIAHNGRDADGNYCIFPSKECRDWKSHSLEVKTWADFVRLHKDEITEYSVMQFSGIDEIERSAIALVKIHKIISYGYGGHGWKYTISRSGSPQEIPVSALQFVQFSFKTKELASEFMKYPDNAQLVKDFYRVDKFAYEEV